MPQAWKQAGLWAAQGNCNWNIQKVPPPVVKLDQGVDWPVTCQINLAEPGWQSCGGLVDAGAKLECQAHGLKQVLAVETEGIEILVSDFWT